MRRAGFGWLVLVFLGAATITWVLRDAPTPGAAAPHPAQPAAPQPHTDVAGRASAAAPVPTAGVARQAVGAAAQPPARAHRVPETDPELERVAAVLAAEPALIDALQDSASHPDPVVRAEAEALVEEALDRARAASITGPDASPDDAAP